MNICLIMPNVFPVPATKGGATEILITNLLKENENRGLIHFTCISVYEEKAKKLSEDYKNTEYIYIDEKRDNLDLTFETNDKYFIQYMDEIYDKIKDKEFDFIIIEGGDITGYEYLLKRFPQKKCIAHIHGDALGNKQINNKIYYKFIAISRYTQKILTKDNIIPNKKVELLYNAINTKNFDKQLSYQEKKILREKYEINKDDVVILFSGRTIPQKGVKELILSFKELKNIEKCKLLIVGSANYGEMIKTQYDYELEKMSLDIRDKIKFTGYISNEELYKIHNISDISIVPSIWEELFGLVVIESMSSGLPLIVTKSGGISEIVNEKCAYIVNKDTQLVNNIADKIDYLVENPIKRKQMGQKGKELAKLYNIDQYYINFYNLIKKIESENKNDR